MRLGARSKHMVDALLLVGCLALALAACKSDDEGGNGDGGSQGSAAGESGNAGTNAGKGGGGESGGGPTAGSSGHAGENAGDASTNDDDAGGGGNHQLDAATGADAGADAGSDAAVGCTELKVIDHFNWCSFAIDGAATHTDGTQTVCVTPGVITVDADPRPNFELGKWHNTDGDTGSGEMPANGTAQVTVGSTAKCIWMCCPFVGGTGCSGAPANCN